MLASGFNRCLAWAAFTNDIFGQKLHERRAYDFGDLQPFETGHFEAAQSHTVAV
jgi:hypothetical protein